MSMKWLGAVVLVVAGLVCSGVVWGQARGTGAGAGAGAGGAQQKPAAPVFVTVVKTDGSNLRGRLDSADPSGVMVQPMLRGKAEGEAVAVKWGEIKSVSSGLTRQKAAEQWKA